VARQNWRHEPAVPPPGTKGSPLIYLGSSSPFSILDLGHRLSSALTLPPPLHPSRRCLCPPTHDRARASASSSAPCASTSAAETHHQCKIRAAAPVRSSTTSGAPRPPPVSPHRPSSPPHPRRLHGHHLHRCLSSSSAPHWVRPPPPHHRLGLL
jgi:hypothetical protein